MTTEYRDAVFNAAEEARMVARLCNTRKSLSTQSQMPVIYHANLTK